MIRVVGVFEPTGAQRGCTWVRLDRGSRSFLYRGSFCTGDLRDIRDVQLNDIRDVQDRLLNDIRDVQAGGLNDSRDVQLRDIRDVQLNDIRDVQFFVTLWKTMRHPPYRLHRDPRRRETLDHDVPRRRAFVLPTDRDDPAFRFESMECPLDGPRLKFGTRGQFLHADPGALAGFEVREGRQGAEHELVSRPGEPRGPGNALRDRRVAAIATHRRPIRASSFATVASGKRFSYSDLVPVRATIDSCSCVAASPAKVPRARDDRRPTCWNHASA